MMPRGWNEKLLVIKLCLMTVCCVAAPHVVAESRIEPAMWEIVGNEELEAEYKKATHFWMTYISGRLRNRAS